MRAVILQSQFGGTVTLSNRTARRISRGDERFFVAALLRMTNGGCGIKRFVAGPTGGPCGTR